MSSQYPPLEDGGFSSQNFLNTEDDTYTLQELENIFAKKFNMQVSGTSTIEGTMNASEINITDNKSIIMNKNRLYFIKLSKRCSFSFRYCLILFFIAK